MATATAARNGPRNLSRRILAAGCLAAALAGLLPVGAAPGQTAAAGKTAATGQKAAAGPAPRVATDIAPVHSLVARIMQGVGQPDLVVPPGASPHGYAMRPSEARMLDEAAAVIWVGPELAPWFGEAAEALAADATSLALASVPGTILRDRREGGRFEAHDHDEGGHAADGHASDHDDPEAADPHLWLDPLNARLWLGAIAETLAAVDPAHALAYRANASAAQSEIDDLVARLSARLAPLRGRPYVVFHDAYQYFELRFDVPAAGAIALGDAVRPSAARVAEIRDMLGHLGAACVFSEPQFEPRVVATVIEGTGAGRGTLDPLGADLAPGPGLYPALLDGMAAGLEACLAPRS